MGFWKTIGKALITEPEMSDEDKIKYMAEQLKSNENCRNCGKKITENESMAGKCKSIWCDGLGNLCENCIESCEKCDKMFCKKKHIHKHRCK